MAPGRTRSILGTATPDPADRVATFKVVTKAIAKAGSTPPLCGPSRHQRSGMPPISLFKDGQNAFTIWRRKLSDVARYFIGGSKHAAIGTPLVNSYKRLVPGMRRRYIAWSAQP